MLTKAKEVPSSYAQAQADFLSLHVQIPGSWYEARGGNLGCDIVTDQGSWPP